MSETISKKWLDEKGRCCGRKPILYKRPQDTYVNFAPYLYCPRCDAAFDPNIKCQVDNWAWIIVNNRENARRRRADD